MELFFLIFASYFSEMEVFGHNHPVPFSKMLTFYRLSPFTLTASYSVPLPYYPQTHIGMNFCLFKIHYSKDNLFTKINGIVKRFSHVGYILCRYIHDKECKGYTGR